MRRARLTRGVEGGTGYNAPAAAKSPVQYFRKYVRIAPATPEQVTFQSRFW
jgi:hypothetical protein